MNLKDKKHVKIYEDFKKFQIKKNRLYDYFMKSFKDINMITPKKIKKKNTMFI